VLSWVYTRAFSRGEPRGSLVYLTSPCALLRGALRSHANQAGSDRAKSENYPRKWRNLVSWLAPCKYQIFGVLYFKIILDYVCCSLRVGI